MSRLDELKKQYPELNVSIFDIMIRMDKSKSYKYIPLLCKILGKRFDVKNQYSNDLNDMKLNLINNMTNKGISTDNLSLSQMYMFTHLLDFFSNETFNTLTEFMEYMEKGKIDKNDVTSYKDIEDVRSALTVAAMKEWNKDLEGHVVKEYEDNKWLIVRPLTFAASTKYGKATKWCTTYQKEKQYFEKYWRQGILAYFINKETGYKFACFKNLSEKNDLSFWNAEDNRVDYLDLETDDYLFSVVRKILKSDLTNKNLCTDEIQQQVHEECLEQQNVLRLFSDNAIRPIEMLAEPEPDIALHVPTMAG